MKELERFESIEKLLLNAKSPVYVFGGWTDIESVQDLEDKIGEIESFIDSFKPKDANQQFRLGMVHELFSIHKNWAQQTFAIGTYYDAIEYRLKIVVTVVTENKKKYFQLFNEKARLAKKNKSLKFYGSLSFRHCKDSGSWRCN